MASLLVVLAILALSGCGNDNLSFFDDAATLIPRLTFESPGAAGATADDEITLGVRFEDVSSSDKWHLFYLSDAAPGRGGVVSRDIPVATSGVLQVTWITSNLPAGDYYLFAEVEGSGATATAAAPGRVVVNHARAGNNSPSVTVTNPNGGEAIAIGSTYTFTWQATDPDGDPLTATIEFSRDGGTVWTTLASDVSGSSWDWEIDSSVSACNSCSIRVTATDDGAGAASDLSDGTFSLYQPITWNGSIASMLAASCAGSSCHSAGATYGHVFVSDDYANAAGTGGSQVEDRIIARSVDADTMPPSGSGYPIFTTEQKATFRKWVTDGMPED